MPTSETAFGNAKRQAILTTTRAIAGYTRDLTNAVQNEDRLWAESAARQIQGLAQSLKELLEV